MLYRDDVYGKIQISEPVLLDLMAAKAMQRLHGVMQHGISALIGITQPVTRFDHCVGTMILVKSLNGDLPEQIAALLHDVSHTAFSHVIDYVVDDHNSQSYHDEMKETYLKNTDIPEILERHGYDWHDFLHEENYPLLEQPAPKLCADRIDYFLRDASGLGLATAVHIERVRQHLVVAAGRIAIDSIEVAQWLGSTFMAADDASWANFREVGIYEVTAQAIRRGLKLGVVSEDDFWGTDEPFWQKLHQAADEELQRLLALISPKTEFVWDAENPDFWVSTKLRAIDPDVVVNGRLRPLSHLDSEFASRRQHYLTTKQGQWPMRILNP